MFIEDIFYFFNDKLFFLGVNLEIEWGDCIVFLGFNGCGKFIFLWMIMGMELLDEG